MILASLQEILENIADIVNQCLGPLGSEGFSWAIIRDFLIQICATLILFVVIKVFFWKPVTNILESRRKVIDEALEDAVKTKEENARIKLELDQQMLEAKNSIKALMDKAQKESNLLKEEIIRQAHDEANLRLKNLEVELEQERTKMNKQIKKEIVDIAFLAASKIIAKEVDKEKYLDVVDDILQGANE